MDKNFNKQYNGKKRGVVLMMPTAVNPSVKEEQLNKPITKEVLSVDELMKRNLSFDYGGKTFEELYKEGK